MKHRDFYLPVIVGVIATPLCYLIGAFFSGGGHVLYSMILFFPYGMLMGLLFQNVSWLIALPVFAVQFPLYGVAVGAAILRDRYRPLVIGLAVAHFLLMMIGFAVEYMQQS
jgi:hypothetical protein